MLDELKMLKLQLQQTVQLTISKMRAQRRYQRMRGSSCGGRSVCQRRLKADDEVAAHTPNRDIEAASAKKSWKQWKVKSRPWSPS